jgi:hypothetical protein
MIHRDVSRGFPRARAAPEPAAVRIACRVLACLVRVSGGAYGDHIPGLLDFLSAHLFLLSYRTFLANVVIAYPRLVPAGFFESLLSESPHLPSAVALLHSVVRKSPAAVPAPAIPALARLLAFAADRPAMPSLLALEAIARLRPLLDLGPLLREFEAARFAIHIEAFFASQTPTFYDTTLVAVFRALDNAAAATLVERPGLLAIATEAIGISKINGHKASFLRAVNDRRVGSNSLHTVEWFEFVEGMLMTHLRQVSASSGGPYVQRHHARVMGLSPSSDLLDSEQGSSASGSDDAVGPHLSVQPLITHRTPSDRLRSYHSVPEFTTPGFDSLENARQPRATEPINTSDLPSLNAAAACAGRRQRWRNARSVLLADLPCTLRQTNG